jgi:hypothetical protein
MISNFYNMGWSLGGEPIMTQGFSVIYLNLHNDAYPNASLNMHICLDEMPVLTIVSLLDNKGVIEKEWSDKEINVTEITAAAQKLNDEGDG